MKNKRFAIATIFTILMLAIISVGCQNSVSKKEENNTITENTSAEKTDKQFDNIAEEIYETEFKGLQVHNGRK